MNHFRLPTDEMQLVAMMDVEAMLPSGSIQYQHSLAHLTSTQSILTQPNTTQPTKLHPTRPTGANPTLPIVPEDQASEHRQPLIQPPVVMEVEMEMEMRVGERGRWSGAEHGVHWHMAGGSCILPTIPPEVRKTASEVACTQG